MVENKKYIEELKILDKLRNAHDSDNNLALITLAVMNLEPNEVFSENKVYDLLETGFSKLPDYLKSALKKIFGETIEMTLFEKMLDCVWNSTVIQPYYRVRTDDELKFADIIVDDSVKVLVNLIKSDLGKPEKKFRC